MSFDFETWKGLTKRERGHQLKDSIGKALALIAPGLPTFGRWPSAGRTAEEQKLAMKQMESIALTYAVGCASLWQISPEIVKATAQAYLEGEVTIFKSIDKGGAHVKPESFPDVNQFRDACLQTFYRLYRTRATEEKKLEDGTVVLITILEPRKANSADVRALEARQLETPITPEQLEAARQKVRKLFEAEAPVLSARKQEEKTA